MDRTSSLLIGAIIGAHPVLIQMSQSVYMRFYIPFFTSLTVFAVYLAITKKSVMYSFLSIIIGFISIQINFTFLPVIPALGLWNLIHLKKYATKRILFLWFIFSSVLFTILLYLTNTFKLIKHPSQIRVLTILANNQVGLLSNFLSDIQSYITYTTNPYKIPINPLLIFIVVTILILLPLIYLTENKRKEMYIFLISVCTGFGIASIHNHYDAPQYFSPFYFIIPLTLLISIGTLLNKVAGKHKPVLYTVLVILLILSLMVPQKRNNEYYYARQISNVILKDIEKRRVATNEFIITDRNEYTVGEYFSPAFWYFIEKEYNKVFTRIIPYESNIAPIVEYPRYVYLLCLFFFRDFQHLRNQYPDIDSSSRNKKCLSKYLDTPNPNSEYQQLIRFEETPLLIDLFVIDYKKPTIINNVP